jgi:glutathione reductase (NADPH)
LGPEGAELINFFDLAMRFDLKATDLRQLLSAYPSVGSDLGSLV